MYLFISLKTVKIDIDHLARSVSEDNRSAFNMLYQVYYENVFRFSYYFLRDKEACREVVSDVFFSIWQSRKKLKEITNLEAYFYIVTKNEAMRYLNRKNEYEKLSLDDFPIELEDLEASSPDGQLIDKEIETLLTQIINELPDKCRLIFLMARQEGLKPKEIGKILSISESTVRVQMKIAVEKIIEKIRPHFPDLTLTVLFGFFTGIYQDIC
ncbi:RNA polymerase sigma factor [Parabacteroides sp. AM08-6]|uniref:RNA polymerase sigma factor n=1 Tax=Parabacteroides sp. AM08-6 TaxID=2292053 RepID=UPI00210715B1|nr:RNA polymerase sigma-70 factor [Parabacteroides sp. AM08-6]